MQFFSITNCHFNYMPTRTLTWPAIRMILPLPTPSFSTSVAFQSLGVPRNNAQFFSPPLKPNTDLLLPRLPSFFGYPIYLASSFSFLLRHWSSIATMSVQPTSSRTQCSTHVGNMLHYLTTTSFANKFRMTIFMLQMLLLQISLQTLSPNLYAAPIFINYYSRFVFPLRAPICGDRLENQDPHPNK